MSETALPEPDRLPGAPHPRHASRVIGHGAAEQDFLTAFAADRLHHAWMITGPRGVGKATLAWKIARFLLENPLADAKTSSLFGEASSPPATIQTQNDSPIAARLAALSEPRLFLMRRSANDKGDRISDDIRVVDVRALARFFSLSAADGGQRVVIVDCMDDMNVSAANALLKMLEEPPEQVTMLLITHQPARLLPTIRSRCRTLRLSALTEPDLSAVLKAIGTETAEDPQALYALSDGSAGMAVRLVETGGMEVYQTLVRILERGDRGAMLALAEKTGARGATAQQDTLFLLLDILLARLARTGAGHPPKTEAAVGEAALLARLSSSPHAAREWATLQAGLSGRIGHGRAVNLDPAALILDTMLKVIETAGQQMARA